MVLSVVPEGAPPPAVAAPPHSRRGVRPVLQGGGRSRGGGGAEPRAPTRAGAWWRVRTVSEAKRDHVAGRIGGRRSCCARASRDAESRRIWLQLRDAPRRDGVDRPAACTSAAARRLSRMSLGRPGAVGARRGGHVEAAPTTDEKLPSGSRRRCSLATVENPLPEC